MWSAEACRRFVTPRLAGARAPGAQNRARRASVRRGARTAKGAPYESESKLSHSIFRLPFNSTILQIQHDRKRQGPQGIEPVDFFDSEERGMRGENQIRKELLRFSTSATGCGSGGK